MTYTLPVPQFVPEDDSCRRIAALAAGLAIDSVGRWGAWADLALPIRGEVERREAKAELDALVVGLFELPESWWPAIFDANNPLRSALVDVERFAKKQRAEATA